MVFYQKVRNSDLQPRDLTKRPKTCTVALLKNMNIFTFLFLAVFMGIPAKSIQTTIAPKTVVYSLPQAQTRQIAKKPEPVKKIKSKDVPKVYEKIVQLKPPTIIQAPVVEAPKASLPVIIYQVPPAPVQPTVVIQKPMEESQPAPIAANEPAPQIVEQVAISKPWTIEIISPAFGKGLTHPHKALPKVTYNPDGTPVDPAIADAFNEDNYVELGGVLRDGDGNIVDTETVKITATDASQNKTLNGTGNYSKEVNGNYYPFHYEFYTPGTHTVTFSAHGVSASVDMQVQ